MDCCSLVIVIVLFVVILAFGAAFATASLSILYVVLLLVYPPCARIAFACSRMIWARTIKKLSNVELNTELTKVKEARALYEEEVRILKMRQSVLANIIQDKTAQSEYQKNNFKIEKNERRIADANARNNILTDLLKEPTEENTN